MAGRTGLISDLRFQISNLKLRILFGPPSVLVPSSVARTARPPERFVRLCAPLFVDFYPALAGFFRGQAFDNFSTVSVENPVKNRHLPVTSS